MGACNYSATSNNMKLVHWPLMGELLQAPHRWTKRNSPPINGQCTNHRILVGRCAVLMCQL